MLEVVGEDRLAVTGRVTLQGAAASEGTVARVRWTDGGSGSLLEVSTQAIGRSLQAPGEAQSFSIEAESLQAAGGEAPSVCATLSVEASNQPEWARVDCLE